MFRLDRFMTLRFCQPLLNSFRLSAGAAIPILMYHSISGDSERGVAHYYRVVTSPKRFSEQMRWLHDHEYEVISLAKLLQRIKEAPQKTGRCAVLTFDDGFRDFLTNAWPVLESFGYTASVFLPTAFIGINRKSFKGRECLTWSEVRDLHSYGISFGSHTVSHPLLNGLEWGAVQRELHDSRLQIEDRLQAPVVSFAYPYAFPKEDRDFVQRFKQELKNQGYRNAVTTVIGSARLGSDPLCLERLPVNDSDDVQFFEAKLSGAYDWMANPQVLMRLVKSHLYRIRSVAA
jgi:peptidoglycan/xylan/chitin deacetylase (PgdA/CDA1 family)